ncbi:hypothetical protein OOK09_37290 [Streptomyces sp. NBC_00059]|nr:hypothetical protein [Streptomyces sp. NBC_00059]MCX5417510.1 hypothetical protein [Streptomyces sp. NBC_00059]
MGDPARLGEPQTGPGTPGAGPTSGSSSGVVAKTPLSRWLSCAPRKAGTSAVASSRAVSKSQFRRGAELADEAGGQAGRAGQVLGPPGIDRGHPLMTERGKVPGDGGTDHSGSDHQNLVRCRRR